MSRLPAGPQVQVSLRSQVPGKAAAGEEDRRLQAGRVHLGPQKVAVSQAVDAVLKVQKLANDWEWYVLQELRPEDSGDAREEPTAKQSPDLTRVRELLIRKSTSNGTL